MYSSYTTLQRAQLAKQEYLDTQEVFLGIYAPGRNAALKASLQDQLHRKFLLTDSLRPEAPRQRRPVCFWSGKTFS